MFYSTPPSSLQHRMHINLSIMKRERNSIILCEIFFASLSLQILFRREVLLVTSLLKGLKDIAAVYSL